MLGVDSPEADAELVTVLATFFKTVGLTPGEVMILVNNRKLMDSRFDGIGIPKDQRPAVSSWIDRREKMSIEAWLKYGADIGLSQVQIESVKQMLADQDLWQQSEELVRFFKAIDALGLREYVRFDPAIVRGLLYYTGTVFEAWEVGGEIKRSILGGGRYDNLLADVGGDPLPAVGYAMGDVVVTLILEKYGLLPKGLDATPAPVLVTIFNDELLLESYTLAAELRRAGLNVTCYPEPSKLSKQFKFADRIGLRVTIVVGPDEVAAGTVAVKDLVSGDQRSVNRKEAAEAIRKILASH
jgi:histidyl-tRNA synthetase